MKYISLLIFSLISLDSIASSCRTIVKYDELQSTIYVVCPELPALSGKEASKIIEDIFASKKFAPDEYKIYFVATKNLISSTSYKSKSLIGWYYTHNQELIVWPNVESKKKILNL